MSTAQLFNIPRTESERAQWALANAASHQLIVTALEAKTPGLRLTRYLLDPIAENDIQNFLLRHQLMHSELDRALNIGGNDFSELDPSSKKGTLETIWQQHAVEHVLAESKLLK
jgi:hypothetical protein